MKAATLACLLAAALAGCATRPPAPVSDRTHELRDATGEYREVVGGDTLYSIAWEAGRDYRELAEWNGLEPPFTIHPGQRLRLTAPPAIARAPASAAESGGGVHVVSKGETLYAIARAAGTSARELAAWNNLNPPYTLQPGQRLRTTRPQGRSRAATTRSPERNAPASRAPKPTPAPAGAPAERPATAGKPVQKPATRERAAAARLGGWVWPAQGTIIERFGRNSSKGIDIGGRQGQAVVAANEGRVVYQGSGLRGYGQLIILKHNAEFLSAYAHCDRIYVREGDVIKRGQKIADMGASGTDRTKLHFEIRYRGTPVDPLQHLPRK